MTDQQCAYPWCTAHHDTGACTCPYAQASPHRAEHCRYNRGDEPPPTTRPSITMRDITVRPPAFFPASKTIREPVGSLLPPRGGRGVPPATGVAAGGL